jgi:hypothetical protein
LAVLGHEKLVAISPDRETTPSVIEGEAATINVIAFQNGMA